MRVPRLYMIKNLEILDIYIKHPGLGDSLFYSHIPRLAKNFGYERVRVHVPLSVYKEEKTDLIWRINPFVDDVLPNKGGRLSPISFRPGVPLLDSIAMDMGLVNEIKNFEPEVFYKPSNKYEGVVVYDGNFISGAGLINEKLIHQMLFQEPDLICLRPLSSKYISSGKDNKYHLSLSSLSDYFDLLASAEKLYCLVSGGASLRPAFGRASTVFYGLGQCAAHRHSLHNTYVDVSMRFWPGLGFIGSQIYRVLRKLKINAT